MRKIDKITLLGKTFSVQQLPARASLKALRRLGKCLSPALKEAMQGTGQTKLADVNVAQFGDALEKLFANLEDDDLDFFVNTFLDGCLVDEKAPLLPVLDVVFQGEAFDLIRLLMHAIKANYQSFFSALHAQGAATLAK